MRRTVVPARRVGVYFADTFSQSSLTSIVRSGSRGVEPSRDFSGAIPFLFAPRKTQKNGASGQRCSKIVHANSLDT
jgi:hypothetical protein